MLNTNPLDLFDEVKVPFFETLNLEFLKAFFAMIAAATSLGVATRVSAT